MAEDFRATRDAQIKRIADAAEQSGVPRDRALKWAEHRMERAMPRVVREREREGTSRVMEIRSK